MAQCARRLMTAVLFLAMAACGSRSGLLVDGEPGATSTSERGIDAGVGAATPVLATEGGGSSAAECASKTTSEACLAAGCVPCEHGCYPDPGDWAGCADNIPVNRFGYGIDAQ